MVKKRYSCGTYNTDTKYEERPHVVGVWFIPFPKQKTYPDMCTMDQDLLPSTWTAKCWQNQRTPLCMLKGQFLIKYFYTKGILTDKLVPNTKVEYLYTSTKSSCMLLGIVYGGYQCPSGNWVVVIGT